MSDQGPLATPRPTVVLESDDEIALTLTALEDRATAHATACSILEQIDLMMALADLTAIPPTSLALLQRARAEAERVVADAARAIRPH